MNDFDARYNYFLVIGFICLYHIQVGCFQTKTKLIFIKHNLLTKEPASWHWGNSWYSDSIKDFVVVVDLYSFESCIPGQM